MMPLQLRHITHCSPCFRTFLAIRQKIVHTAQSRGIGTPISFGIWKLSERRFLQFFANPCTVHWIAYYALTSVSEIL